MNEYGFNYMNYINNIPSSMDGIINKFNFNNTMNINDKFNNMLNKKEKLEEPYDGFLKGNLFTKLYDPYKSYKPIKLDADNEREALLYQIMQYKFVLIELNLYLDTNPNDKDMIELYRKYLMNEKQMCEKYEKMYGPLTVNSNYLDNDNWTWKNSPWPWEVM